MDTTTTRDAAPIRLAGGRRQRPDPPPEPEPETDPAPADDLADGVMPTTAELLELLGASDPPPPPDWWAPAWHRRQRRARCRIQQYLREGPHTAVMLHQRAGDFERAEIEYALADLCATGVLETEIKLGAGRRRGHPEPAVWWRLAPEVG